MIGGRRACVRIWHPLPCADATANPGSRFYAAGQGTEAGALFKLFTSKTGTSGLCIVAGIAAVVLRIIYLSSTREAAQSAPQPSQTSRTAQRGSAVGSLSLPAGAVVKSVSLSGDRLAVHYEAGSEAGILIVDVVTGAEVRRIEIAPAGPQP